MRLHSAALSMCLIVAAMTGCAGLGTPKSDLTAELSKAGTPGSEAANTAKVDIIFQPDSGQPERMERSLTEATTVQQMLVQSGPRRSIVASRSKSIARFPMAGAHKIPCEYDRETRQINPENDYALMPGDRLIVKEDPSTIVDDIMRSAGGGLANVLPPAASKRRRANTESKAKPGLSLWRASTPLSRHFRLQLAPPLFRCGQLLRKGSRPHCAGGGPPLDPLPT